MTESVYRPKPNQQQRRLTMDFDFAVLSNSENPRSIVYNIDTGQEVATFGIDQAGQEMAQRVCETLNAYVAEHGTAF